MKTNGNGGFNRLGIISDGMNRVIDIGSFCRIEKRYTHSDRVDKPLLMEVFDSAGTRTDTLTYHTDHLGSVRYMTDESGDLVNYYDYDSYGRPTVMAETIEQPFMYTAREWESALGLYQYRARHYDPDTGRFMQEDPIGFAAGDLNISRYVGNNPMNLTDPSGMSAASESGALAQVGAVSAGASAIGAGLNCIFLGIADSVALAGESNEIGVDLNSCAAQAGRELAIGAAVGFIPSAALGRGMRAASARQASLAAFKMSLASGKNKGVVAALVTRNGNVYLGFSKKAGQQLPLNPSLAKYCTSSRRCAEIDAINNALRNGDDVNGAMMSVRSNASGGPKGRPSGPGAPTNPCSSCNDALDNFNISIAN